MKILSIVKDTEDFLFVALAKIKSIADYYTAIDFCYIDVLMGIRYIKMEFE